MPITYDAVKSLSAELYSSSLRGIPEDAKAALRLAGSTESDPGARQVLAMMLRSAERAESTGNFICSDAGVPVYYVKIGTAARLEGNIKQAIVDGFAQLVQTIKPPLLKHVTNPITLERGYHGKDMPIVTWDIADGADYLEMTCAPKALGSGRWAALEIFSFPSLETIETYIMECVLKAGPQHCPPVVIGVGIGGTFDHCAKLAKLATLRSIGEHHPEQQIADMERRLLAAVNKTGFGPMGTKGDTTALAVNVDYSAGHGFTPVAVCFNCWINRRMTARIYDDGRVEYVQ